MSDIVADYTLFFEGNEDDKEGKGKYLRKVNRLRRMLRAQDFRIVFDATGHLNEINEELQQRVCAYRTATAVRIKAVK